MERDAAGIMGLLARALAATRAYGSTSATRQAAAAAPAVPGSALASLPLCLPASLPLCLSRSHLRCERSLHRHPPLTGARCLLRPGAAVGARPGSMWWRFPVGLTGPSATGLARCCAYGAPSLRPSTS